MDITVKLSEQETELLKSLLSKAEVRQAMNDVRLRLLDKLNASASTPPIHPDVQAISGLLPSDLDVEDEYHSHQLRKHR